MTRKQESSPIQPLDWSYAAGFFDSSGSLGPPRWRRGPRLRVGSYNRRVLEDLRRLAGSGSISVEPRRRRTYYRLEFHTWEGVTQFLERGSPIPPSKEAPGGGVAEDLASNTMTTCPTPSPQGGAPRGWGWDFSTSLLVNNVLLTVLWSNAPAW